VTRLTSLNRKLLRDLWQMKAQALAIAMVVASGVAMFVMYLSAFSSLRATQRSYYEQQRFADVFATLKRAPLSLAAEVAAIPGVSAVEARVVTNVTLDLEGMVEPATGRLLSIPATRRPRVNDLFVRRGRWIEPGRSDEVLASEAFVTAHGLAPGDHVRAVINGRLRRLTIVGVALSPEFIYSIRPGELIPDDRLFGIFWMEREALASAFDMEGGFNDLALDLAAGASSEAVVERLDHLLEPYGGLGALPRALQLSHWTLENELAQLQSFGFMLPLIFLTVAAFILNVALTRALALQRPQIAALKALGYGNRELGWHYLKWALAIGAIGVVVGVAGGAWLGSTLIELYNRYFRFPVLLFQVPASVVAGATALTLMAAGLGAIGAVRRAVSIPPAEAMRPEPPSGYRRVAIETRFVGRRLGTAGRMVLRNVSRHPFRAAASIFGISFAVAILMIGFVFGQAIERLILTQFWDAERQDVTVSFVEPRSERARYELARLPGVIAVEPQRTVPVRIHAGHHERYLAITGVPDTQRLKRIVDREGRPTDLPPSGLVLSQILAQVLDVRPGDAVTIDVLEGHRPVRTVIVTGLVDDIMGLSAYMNAGALHDVMRESDVVSGALLVVDAATEERLSRELKALPAVAGVGFKRAVLRNFREVMAANMNLSIGINLVFAGIIAFGVVYNAARVSLSERSRELASLRVLGFTRGEISLILLGELAVLTLAALPAGALFGYLLAALIVGSIESEVYRFPLYVSTQAVAQSFLGIIAAATISGLLVRRRLDRLDLVAVLKIRE
jgi:putative ABC transport system permease protein